MRICSKHQPLFALAMIVCAAAASSAASAGRSPSELPAKVEFNRDIRPILSEKCFACHGPDKNKREADLRLDTREGLLGTAEKAGVVVSGKPLESEFWRRITTDSEDERMPAKDSGKELTETEKQLLRRWIEQGADWQGHWLFQPIGRPDPPLIDPALASFRRNDVDNFVLAALKEHTLEPSAEADRATLLRRLHFDLTGLPPSVEELDAFLADTAPDTYEKAVDRLLGSPHYGEQMALWWLDLVRYADSVGYHGDQPVSVWPYRDYVIKSFNENKPFDRFTLEQLAGDLLPEGTVEEKIASGYNRLGMMSAEGGVQPNEYLAKYVAERVRNLGGTWLGVTLGCCECHDHKFDPFLTRDFYSLESFFADIQERGLYSGANTTGDWGPKIELPSPQQAAAKQRLDAEIAAARTTLDTPTAELDAAQKKWESEPPGKLPEKVATLRNVPADKRTDQQREELAAYYRSIAPALEPARQKLAEFEKQKAELTAAIPTALITVSVAPRTIRVLPRGNWMDESNDPLVPAVPSFLPQPPAHEGRLTRVDLAQWVTSRDNPITARVFVNRMWELFLGAGLSRKLDDHGSQGDWPSHPLLLDWLAGQFMDSGWDAKHVVKLIVMSGTYRQASHASPDVREKDPDNRWLARQGRFRLDAEKVRDNALAVSGLLVDKIGGPSVKPYQPPGYWSYLNFPPREWQNGTGDELYRRGLYTHWQRQYLHPAMLAFDAPGREECIADRSRSNTPLQSLVLMNDPEFVEAARVFAERILERPEAAASGRIDWAFRCALCRPPEESERRVLEQLLNNQRVEYQQDRKSADELLAVGARPIPENVDRVELAAWTSIARAILNLHETITRY